MVDPCGWVYDYSFFPGLLKSEVPGKGLPSPSGTLRCEDVCPFNEKDPCERLIPSIYEDTDPTKTPSNKACVPLPDPLEDPQSMD